ncbi:MAG: NADH-quinone oxidoreductase subunit C [Candidatus Omnitrophica bacterium]|nr:NADH-quinone oxidoreductase subunit C [Candidatus Omnitrophota bacterium]
MSLEEKIKQALVSKFDFLAGRIVISRPRRIFIQVELERLNDVFDYAVKQLVFSHLCTITGLDEGLTFGVVYHIADKNGIVLNLRTAVPKINPVLRTITFYFPGAEIYERELMDLLGVKIDSLPPGLRYPLPDDWPQDEFPLRKGWKPKAENREQKTENREQKT